MIYWIPVIGYAVAVYQLEMAKRDEKSLGTKYVMLSDRVQKCMSNLDIAFWSILATFAVFLVIVLIIGLK